MNLLKRLAVAASLSLAAFGAAQANAKDAAIGDLVITQPWIKATIGKADVAGAYATITNKGTADDTLVSVSVDNVPTVQIHDMKMEGETMKMEELKDGLPIPAGQTVEIKPRAIHIMLMGLKAGFKAGDVVKGAMTFQKAGKIDVEFDVKGN